MYTQVFTGGLYMILPISRFDNLCLRDIFVFTFKAFLNLYTSFM